MAEEKAEEKSVTQPWTYTHVHGSEHPSNNPPLTIVSEASEEAIAKEEATMNAAYAKEHAAGPPGIEQQAEPKAAAAQQNLDDMTVAELKEVAAQKGVHVNWDDNKADIIKAIKKGK